jgi:hypothetical protein
MIYENWYTYNPSLSLILHARRGEEYTSRTRRPFDPAGTSRGVSVVTSAAVLKGRIRALQRGYAFFFLLISPAEQMPCLFAPHENMKRY